MIAEANRQLRTMATITAKIDEGLIICKGKKLFLTYAMTVLADAVSVGFFLFGSARLFLGEPGRKDVISTALKQARRFLEIFGGVQLSNQNFF